MTRARDVANLIGSGNYSSTTFTATAGQTAFTISHTQGFVQVFMNGLLLDETADYTSNGTAITLTSGAAAGDEIEVVAYNTFSVGDALPTSGGTFTGAVTAANGLTVDDDGATPLTVDRATSDGTIIDVQRGGSSVGGVNAHGGSLVVGGGDVGIGFYQAANALVPYDQSTNAVRDNAIDLGYPSTYRWKDLYLGGGAYIGGTGSANYLDDYEEGTWTPAPSSGTMSTGTAWYIKIGNMVHCGANIWNFSDRTSNNHLRSNVPFTSASGVTATGSIIGRYINTGTQSTWTPYLSASDSSIYFYRNPSDADYTTLKHSDLNNSAADLHFHITYKTA